MLYGVMARKSPLQRAIQKIGSQAALARALGIKIQAVHQWIEVPPLRVLDVERVTGIPRHELRPDIYPAERERAR